MKKRMVIPGILLLLLIVGAVLFMNHRWIKTITNLKLSESTDSLRNPDRGGYYIQGFTIDGTSGEIGDISNNYFLNQETDLALIEINLKNFNTGAISDQGLDQIRDLFEKLRGFKKDYVIRCLYDWDGKAGLAEPMSRAIIEQHMKQIGPILTQNEDIIYCVQGLFTGNWGEGNGSRYSGDDLKVLADTFINATNGKFFLSVRVPAIWRNITESSDVSSVCEGTGFYRKLSLFNDGMLGNETDLGTYGVLSKNDTDAGSLWRRDDEIEFQSDLCQFVPNGGEVVIDNSLNDFEASVEYLRKVHASYINLDYDRTVFEKWSRFKIHSDDVWDGTDGKYYIFEHLGYRFVVDTSEVKYHYLKNSVTVNADVKNVGFAPIYEDVEVVLLCQSDDVSKEFKMSGDAINKLTGDENQTQKYTVSIPARELKIQDYRLSIELRTKSGEVIKTANVTDTDDVVIGEIKAR